MTKDIPYCPLMSAGSDIDKVCTLERCAWFNPSIKKCSVYLIGFNALQEATLRQKEIKR